MSETTNQEQKKTNIAEKRKEVGEKLNAFLRENKIKLVGGIEFPLYKKLPVEAELAIAVLNRHEANMTVEFILEEEEHDEQPKELSISA